LEYKVHAIAMADLIFIRRARRATLIVVLLNFDRATIETALRIYLVHHIVNSCHGLSPNQGLGAR